MAELRAEKGVEEPVNPLICPFCNGEFRNLPRDTEVFLCGWCRNRLVVEKNVPPPDIRALFSLDFSVLAAFGEEARRARTIRRIITYGEAWKENQKNYYCMLEMCILSCVYAAFSLYMQRLGSSLLIFNNLLFPAIPMAIAVYYNFLFTLRRQELVRKDVPVIRPEPL
jgi:hypothetical protein